jgi:predicted MPP superfamily phosphohydrolase
MSPTRIILFLAITVFLSVYLGCRYYMAARTAARRPVSVLLAAIGASLGIGFFASNIARFAGLRMPAMLTDIFAIAMPCTLYMVLGFLAADALRMVRLYPERITRAREFLAILAASLAFTAYGLWNMKTIAVREVGIKVPKPGVDLKIAFVADLHVGGPGMTPAKLERAVAAINAAKPDIVLLGGDIIDNYIADLRAGGYPAILRGLEPRYGTFAVLGNHEYYRNDIGEVVREFSASGIRTLLDASETVGGMQLVGATDPASQRFGKQQVPLRDIIPHGEGFKLLLIHNPNRIREAAAAGADLMLSGHTHCGQLFPISLLVGMMYDVSCGYGKSGALQAYVTSGIGTWGTPVRTSGRSEIVILHIKSE